MFSHLPRVGRHCVPGMGRSYTLARMDDRPVPGSLAWHQPQGPPVGGHQSWRSGISRPLPIRGAVKSGLGAGDCRAPAEHPSRPWSFETAVRRAACLRPRPGASRTALWHRVEGYENTREAPISSARAPHLGRMRSHRARSMGKGRTSEVELRCPTSAAIPGLCSTSALASIQSLVPPAAYVEVVRAASSVAFFI